MSVVVDHVQLFARQFGHPVDVDWVCSCGFVGGEPIHPAIDLAGGRMHDPQRRIDPPHRLEQVCMIQRIQLQVELRIDHRRRVADLTGEVEHQIGASDHVGDEIATESRIQDHDVQTVDVATITTVGRHQCVDHANCGAHGNQTVDEVGTDESQTTRHDTDSSAQISRRFPPVVLHHSPKLLHRTATPAATLGSVDEQEYRLMAENGDQHWWYESTRALLKQLIEPHLGPAETALYLDAAGGTGATGGWLADRAPTVLIDYEPFALQTARTDHPGYRVTRGDLNHLPFADRAFDAVMCVTALYHRMNPDPAVVVREFARVAKPGATICLIEPGGQRLWRSHDDVTQAARRFSIRDLREIAESAGLDVLRATGAYSFLVPPAYAMHLFERGASKSDVGRNQGGLGGSLALAARAERRLLRRFDLPFGLSAVVVARRPA